MTKKYVVILFVLVLIGTLVAWYLNQFVFSFLPDELNDNFFLFALSVLGSVTAIQGAIAAIKWLVDLFVTSPPPPGEIDLLKQELRSLSGSINEDEARRFTAKILAEKEDAFWEQISSDTLNREILHTLVKDPFWLEGLLDLYRQGKDGCFPDNPGALLKNLFAVQWVPEKIGREGFVKIEILEIALGTAIDFITLERANRTISYSLSRERFTYEQVLYALSMRSIRWFYIKSNFQQILTDLSYKKESWEEFLLSPRDRIYNLINPFLNFWAKAIFSVYSLIGWIVRLLRIIFRIFTFYYFIRKIQIRRGQELLELLERTHIFVREGYRIDFSNRYWEQYLKAISALKPLVDSYDFQLSDVPHYWQEQSPYRQEEIVLMSLGISGDYLDFIDKLSKKNPYMAGLCLVNINDDSLSSISLHNIRTNIHNIRTNIVNWIVKNIYSNPWPETRRTYLLSALLTKLCHNNPGVIVDILNSHNKDTKHGTYNEFLYVDFAKLIAQYGEHAVPVLRSIWREDLRPEIQKTIMKALGEINSRSAASLLHEIVLTEIIMPDKTDDASFYAANYYAATILATCYDDWKANNFVLDGLQGKKGINDFRKAWVALSVGGKGAIRIALAALNNLYRDSQLDNPDFPYRRRFLEFLGDLDDRSVAKNCLVELLKSPRKELKLLALHGLKGRHLGDEISHLLACLYGQDEQIRLKALWVILSLKENTDEKILSALVSSLYDPNPTIIAEAIDGLNNSAPTKQLSKVEKTRLLMGKLGDDRFVTEVEDGDIDKPLRRRDKNFKLRNKIGKPVSARAMQVIIEQNLFLLLGPDEIDELRSWVEKGLADDREFDDGEGLTGTIANYASHYLAELQPKPDSTR